MFSRMFTLIKHNKCNESVLTDSSVRENCMILMEGELSRGLLKIFSTTFTSWMKTWSSTLRYKKVIYRLFSFLVRKLNGFREFHIIGCSRFSPKVSYFEIYMDKIRDLLDGESVYFVSGRPKYRLQRIISKPDFAIIKTH